MKNMSQGITQEEWDAIKRLGKCQYNEEVDMADIQLSKSVFERLYTDRVRLDWISDPLNPFSYSIRTTGETVVKAPGAAVCRNLRYAIDYAMKEYEREIYHRKG